MKKAAFILKNAPKYELLQRMTARHPNLVDADTMTAVLVMLSKASEMLATLDERLAMFGLSQGRFAVLCLLTLEPEENLIPSDLAARLNVTRSTITGLLDGLEKEELIEREDYLTDRRIWKIKLTEKGKQFIDQIIPQHFKWLAELMKNLTIAEQGQLINLVSKINPPAIAEPENNN